ncbi:MAG: lipase [Microbacterium sp.]|uniref:GDSL-type esterase/lipase family protein n=1 Tax=Microbacterium sp. TaxID=51671 RepID=UPI000DB8686C|nr:GDSL-type esterase/lipase family protein [Microbacterium sp.]PZU36367.1 MAG: lipase [Microbacterium sp.]
MGGSAGSRWTYETSDLVGFLQGAIDLEVGPDSVAPLRVPAERLRQMRDATLDRVARSTSAVRLEFNTTASWIELDVSVARFVPERLMPNGRPAVFALVSDDVSIELLSKREAVASIAFDGAVSHSAGAREMLRWEFERRPQTRTVEVWLPTAAAVHLHVLRSDKPVKPADRKRLRWVHHGSSISHGADQRSPLATWPAVVARERAWDLTNLGLGGHAHADGFTARAIRDQPADIITVKIGINVVNGDTMRERTFRSALHSFLDTVREGHPETPLLVIGPISCPMHEDTHGPTVQESDGTLHAHGENAPAAGKLTLIQAREIAREVVADRLADQNLQYMDGRRLLGEADAHLLYDSLHPDEEGHALIADRFLQAVDVTTVDGRTKLELVKEDP